MCRIRFAVDAVDVQSCFLKPGGAKFTQKGQIIPIWIITDLFKKIVLSNHTKMPY